MKSAAAQAIDLASAGMGRILRLDSYISSLMATGAEAAGSDLVIAAHDYLFGLESRVAGNIEISPRKGGVDLLNGICMRSSTHSASLSYIHAPFVRVEVIRL